MFLLFFVFYVKAALVQGNGLEQQNGGHGMHEVSLFLFSYNQLFVNFFVCQLFVYKMSISAICLHFC